MAETQKIVILNFGGQYTQLIARAWRRFARKTPWA